jgi:hypothetical protein
VNPLKKLKLKSQLRNCDYLLAGNVIKQQYYDANKSTVINRLIDDFMAEPGFDSALKLIEYNDMMVFYFTESCAGGLYIRKQDPYKTGPFTPIESDSYTQQPSNDSFLTPPLDSPLGVTKGEVASTDWRNEKQRQILEESEAWMDQIIASGSRKQANTASSSSEAASWHENQSEEKFSSLDDARYTTDHFDDLPELDLEETLVMKPVNPSDNAFDDIADDPAQTFTKPVQVPVFEPTAEPITEPIVERTDIASEHAVNAIEEEPIQTAPAFVPIEPVDPIPVQSPKPKKRSYSNVIATLQIDIHTMSKQLEEYRRELSYYPSNEKQLVSWIQSLETAIEEFSEVVDLLEDDLS